MTKKSAQMISADVVEYFEYTQERQFVAVDDTILAWVERKMTDQDVKAIALRLVWNKDKLSKGIPIREFLGVSEPTWIPFSIRDVSTFERFGRVLVKLHLFCIGGSVAGSLVKKDMPAGYSYVFARQLGFNRRYRFDGLEMLHTFVGMQFAGLVVPSEESGLEFSTYKCSSSMTEHNKALIHERVTESFSPNSKGCI